MSAQIGDQATYGKKKEGFDINDEVKIENNAIKMSLNCVYLVRGLPNSGKSTFGGIMHHLYEELGMNVEHFEANDYVYHPPGVDEDDPRFGKYVYDSAQHSQCWDLCLKAASAAMHDKAVNAVIVSNTFTTFAELEPFILVAKKTGRTLFVIGMDNFHDGDNGRGVPLDVVWDMQQRYQHHPVSRSLVKPSPSPHRPTAAEVGLAASDPSLD